MPVRRAADPLSTQYVWDAIKLANHQRQVADLTHVTKHIQKISDCSPNQADLYIKQSLEDGLIVEVRRVVVKGTNVGNEADSYKINRLDDLETAKDDGHDWYCIECHLAGDVNFCGTTNCNRVFHTECSTNARQKQTLFPKKNHTSFSASSTSLNNSDLNISIASQNDNGEIKHTSIVTESDKSGIDLNIKDNTVVENNNAVEGGSISESSSTSGKGCDYIYDESICSFCNLAASDPGTDLDLDEFHYLLNFVFLRIKSWVPERLTSTLNGELKFEWYTPSEMRWRAGQLFYQHMDMALIDLKIRSKEFLTFSQFQSEVYTMLHNVAVFHGVESQEFGAAELMVRDMKHDISEIQNCVDCYKHSNEKINNKWFCLPCRVPHKLVWAKQKGYPYWPAKVIRETDTSCDVRFFSGKYERSVLSKNCVKPITTSLSQIQVKKTATFNRALEELTLHRKLLDNPNEVAKVQTPTEVKVRKSVSKPRKSLPLQKDNFNTSKTTRTRKAKEVSEDVYEFPDVSPLSNIVPKDEENVKRKIYLPSEGPAPKIKKRSLPATKTKVAKGADIIDITDLEEDKINSFQFLTENGEFRDCGQEQVTSSTELDREDIFNMRETNDSVGVMQKLEQPFSDAVEKMRRKLETCKDKKQLISMAMDSMQSETDRLINEHNDTLKRLFESHNGQISETKKKQWCYNCEQDAIYHCCWNTAYCSPTCQQQHWQAEHKKVCRRKR